MGMKCKKLLALAAAAALLCGGGLTGWRTALADEAEDRDVPEIETLEPFGYYGRALEAQLDMDDLFLVSEGDDAAAALNTDVKVKDTMVVSSRQIDEMVEAELSSGNYTWESPLVISDPYQNAPLTGMILFTTQQPCAVRITVKGHTEGADLTGVLPEATDHRVPVIGLYPGEDTPILLELLDADGAATQSQELSMYAEPLPESMNDMVQPVKTSGASACGLVLLSGQGCKRPFACDCNGDIRWYGPRKVGNYGVYVLSNGHLIVQDDMGCTFCQQKPQTTNLYEMDLLGRYWRLYYLANGTHHEVIEKEPGGNLLCLTSTLEDHYEDEIVELDRQTGAIVNELELIDIFGQTHTDMIDWAHINTVSWRASDDSILISCRNLHAVIKIGWTDHKLDWILGDPSFWAGTPFEDYVLKPVGEFNWQYHQHTAYWLDADLDGDPRTQEISMFDNHIQSYRHIDTYDGLPDSYAKVFAVDEEARTVGLVKSLTVVRSTITSNVDYDAASGHILAMCGYVPADVWNGRQGMLYEMDYESGEVLNQLSILKTFYRAPRLVMDYETLSKPMDVEADYIKGTLKQAVETADTVDVPDKTVPEDESLTVSLIGQVLYVEALDHTVSQVIFKGNEHTFVYDAATVREYYDKYQKFSVPMAIPTQPLPADDYRLLCVYKDELYDLGKHIEKQ